MSDDMQKPGRRWMGPVLVVSLALNLLVIGALGGALVMREKWQGGRHEARGMTGGPLIHALDRDDRRKLGRALRDLRRDRGVTHEARAKTMAALISDLRAVPFDAAAVAARLAETHAVFGQDIEAAHGLLVAHIAAMSDDERAEFADRVEQYRHRRHMRRE